MEKIRKHIESKLGEIHLFSEITERNGYYYCHVDIPSEKNFDFSKSIFEVVTVKRNIAGTCFLTLRVEKNFIDFCIQNQNGGSVKEALKALGN